MILALVFLFLSYHAMHLFYALSINDDKVLRSREWNFFPAKFWFQWPIINRWENIQWFPPMFWIPWIVYPFIIINFSILDFYFFIWCSIRFAKKNLTYLLRALQVKLISIKLKILIFYLLHCTVKISRVIKLLTEPISTKHVNKRYKVCTKKS